MLAIGPSTIRVAVANRAGIFALWFLVFLIGSMPLAMLISMIHGLDRLAEVVFFLPGFMLAFFNSVRLTTSGPTPAFPSRIQEFLTILVWGTTAISFAWATRNHRLRISILGAPLAILAVTVVLNLLLKAWGVTVQLNGP